MTWGAFAKIVNIYISAGDRVLADAPGEVVMSVDQRGLAKYSLRARKILIVGRRAGLRADADGCAN